MNLSDPINGIRLPRRSLKWLQESLLQSNRDYLPKPPKHYFADNPVTYDEQRRAFFDFDRQCVWDLVVLIERLMTQWGNPHAEAILGQEHGSCVLSPSWRKLFALTIADCIYPGYLNLQPDYISATVVDQLTTRCICKDLWEQEPWLRAFMDRHRVPCLDRSGHHLVFGGNISFHAQLEKLMSEQAPFEDRFVATGYLIASRLAWRHLHVAPDWSLATMLVFIYQYFAPRQAFSMLMEHFHGDQHDFCKSAFDIGCDEALQALSRLALEKAPSQFLECRLAEIK